MRDSQGHPRSAGRVKIQRIAATQWANFSAGVSYCKDELSGLAYLKKGNCCHAMTTLFALVFWAIYPISIASEPVHTKDSSIAKVPGIDPWAHCRASGSCEMNSGKPSTQEVDPFLFLGRVMDKESARWRQYSNAIERYPDVRSCLVRIEQSKAVPNLLLIDWERIGAGRGAEVCVFRIARSLESHLDVIRWLAFHEFNLDSLARRGSSKFKPQYTDEPVWQLTASWSVQQYREHNSSFLADFSGIVWLQGYQLVVEFNQDEKVVGVSAITLTK